MGSVRNKRHAAGRQQQQQQQQQQHQATKKKRKQQKQQQQQQHRQDLRLTLALTKSGGVELKGRLKKKRKKNSDRTGGRMADSGQQQQQATDSGGISSSSSDPPAQQPQMSESADTDVELKSAEDGQETTSSSSPPQPSPSAAPEDEEEATGDRHNDATSDHESSTSTVDASCLVTMETVVPEDELTTTKKVVMATKTEEESDADEDDQLQQKREEDEEKVDYKKPRPSKEEDSAEEVDGDGGLSVTCGDNVARLYLSKLRLIARERVQSQCIRFDGTWLTPNEFQRESGREAAKDWKRTIRHSGLCLKQLLSDGIFDFSVSPPVCLCITCLSSTATAASAASAGGGVPTRRSHGATTNEEMEITARHPTLSSPLSASVSFDASAISPDQHQQHQHQHQEEECLISGLGSAAAVAASAGANATDAAAAAAAVYQLGDRDCKKERRRRRSKQRPVKEKRKIASSSASTSLSTHSSSACLLPADDSAMFRSADNSKRRRKSSSTPHFLRPTEEERMEEVAGGGGEETLEASRLTTTSDEMTAESDALVVRQQLDGGVTMPTDQMTLDVEDAKAAATDQVTSKVDGMTADDATVVASELHPAMPVLDAPVGDTRCNHGQEADVNRKKRRRKKNRKTISSIETSSDIQQVTNRDCGQADGHHSVIIDHMSQDPDDRQSSKENQAVEETTGKAATTNHVNEDGCNVEASACFQAICDEVQKQTTTKTQGSTEGQQVTSGKFEKNVDGKKVYEIDLSADDAVMGNPDGRSHATELATGRKSPALINSSANDYIKRHLRSSSQSIPLPPEESAHVEEVECEGQTKETIKPLEDDVGIVPRDLLTPTDKEVCSQQPGIDGCHHPLHDKSDVHVDGVLRDESIHNIPATLLSKDGGGHSIKSCSKSDHHHPADRVTLPSAEHLPQVTPGVGVQSDGTSTAPSDQSTETVTGSEVPAGANLPVNATTSRNPHLVAVLAELKQKKQLASVKKQNYETSQSVLNSDRSKGGTGVSCCPPTANDAKVSFDVASRFLAAAASAVHPSTLSSFSQPPRVDSNQPVSSLSGHYQSTQTLQQSPGSCADLTSSSKVSVMSKAAEGQSGTSVVKHRTKQTTSASGGRSESNRKRSCRSSTAEGKASKTVDGGKHVTSGKEVNSGVGGVGSVGSGIPLSLPSGLYGLSPSQLASLPFPASPYSLFPPYLFMGFPLQPLLPSCPSSDGKGMPSFGMAQSLAAAAAAAASAASDHPGSTQATQPQQPQPPAGGSRKRRSNQSGKSSGQKSRRGSQTTTTSATGAGPGDRSPAVGMNPMTGTSASAMGSEKMMPVTSDLLNSMMAFDLLRSRIGMSPPSAAVGPGGLDSPKSTPFYFPWLKPDPSKSEVLFGSSGPSSSSHSLLRAMTSDVKLQQAASRTLAASPSWSDVFTRQHEQHSKRPKTGGDFRPFDPMSCGGVIDKKVTATPPPPLFSPDFKVSRRRGDNNKASSHHLPSTDQKPFSLTASDHLKMSHHYHQSSLPDSHFYDDVGALDLSLK